MSNTIGETTPARTGKGVGVILSMTLFDPGAIFCLDAKGEARAKCEDEERARRERDGGL